MNHVVEFLKTQDNLQQANAALKKAYKNPVVVRRIVSLMNDNKFNLTPDENPYAEETESYNITNDDAKILIGYYDFCDRKKKEEDKAYQKIYPYPASFCDGTVLYLPDKYA